MQNTDNNSKPKQMFIKEKGQENKAKKYLPADVPKENFPLLEPYLYLCETPGKGIRTQLIEGFNLWLKVDSAKIQIIDNIVGMLHTASLLIDDIEDNSKLRRGRPVAHAIFGIPNTINCGNYVYFLAMKEVKKLQHSEALDVILDEFLKLHVGQGKDIYWRDSQNIDCPTEEEYKQMVIDKTGGLFRLGVRLLQLFSEDKRDYMNLLRDLSLYFQIRDDYINLQSEAYMVNKSFCEDLTEGKFSFPIIHSIMADPEDSRLIKILKQRTEDPDIKRYAVEYMRSTDSFSYTKKVLKELHLSSFQKINELGGNIILETILKKLEESM